jgi:SAM-dependent methyltransferase
MMNSSDSNVVLSEQKDFLWLNIREIPYFRALVRAVEAAYYQDYLLDEPTLDVGCGDGHFARITFDKPLQVGIDPWWAPLKRANQGQYEITIQCDGAKTPFENGHFGSAVSNSVLEHIPHVREVLKETGRVLKPGGLFLFCVPNPRYFSELSIAGILRKFGLNRFADGYTEWFRKISRVSHAVDQTVWREWLEDAGFELVKSWDYFSPQAMRTLEWGHYFGVPSVLARLLFGKWIIAPYHWNLWIIDRIIRPYASLEPHLQGTFSFYVARKK